MTKLFMTFLILSITPSVFAETITLKNGNTIEGKIVEQTLERIKVDPGIGVPLTYYTDEIDSVDGISIAEPSRTMDDTLSGVHDETRYFPTDEVSKKRTHKNESHLSRHPTLSKLFSWECQKKKLKKQLAIN